MTNYEVLLFDLVGVLVTFDAEVTRTILDLSRLEHIDFGSFWVASPATRAFDLGKIAPAEFAQGIVRELSLELQPEDFLTLYGKWPQRLDDGVEHLLAELKGKYRLACLSNINQVTWPIIRDNFGLGRLLDAYFLSFEIEMLKPDRQVFLHVIDQLRCIPGRIAFFDDSEMNVLAAREVGIHAYLARGAKEVLALLERLSIL